MSEVHEHIGWLGHKVRDRITGFSGVAASVSFDLYGCVQVAVSPPANDKGELPDGKWFDIGRLEREGGERVMEPPARWSDDKGPTAKPPRGRA